MSERQPLFLRLPEIYRIRDSEQTPRGQLAAYVALFDDVFQALHDNVDALYHDLFIDTCDDWVVPYIADLLGTTHLSGDPWTLRADVARTVFHRRRKGTLGAVESLTYTLSGWAVHAVELRERLAWAQHLNHQRPDAGGQPPLAARASIMTAVRGGTVTLRDPALLSFIGGASDPFAHLADVKPPEAVVVPYNLPTLAVFLWRLEAYTLPVVQPCYRAVAPIAGADAGFASQAVRFDLHPQGEPTVLFNTHRYAADDEPPRLTGDDAVPGPMPAARLTDGTPSGRPQHYVDVRHYATAPPAAPAADAVGLTLHVPDAAGTGPWRLRGANLCAWELGLRPPLRADEIAIDPRTGRLVIGVADPDAATRADHLRLGLLASPTYGFAGPTGAHPLVRPPTPPLWREQVPLVRRVDAQGGATALQDALADLDTLTAPLIVEIADSMTYSLDIAAVSGAGNDGGVSTLRPNASLWIRAVAGQRPVIRLVRPLALRPSDVLDGAAAARMAELTVVLEGLYLTRDAAFPAAGALIERAAVHRLELHGCTLDPGGARALDGAVQPIRAALRLANDYGFADPAEQTAFDQTPEIVLRQVIAGPLALDDGYRLFLSRSIVDAGSGVQASAPALAVGAATGDPELAWGPHLVVGMPEDFAGPPEHDGGLTCFGRMRVEQCRGAGGIWPHRVAVHQTQEGCIRFSAFLATGNRLPPHHGCVFGARVTTRFTSERFGDSGYAQLALACDRRLLERGPHDDEMGAFGYLGNAHKWKNVSIRQREFVPVGIRPVLIAIT